MVKEQFRRTFLSVYALPTQSLLALSLSAGLSSLRLPACQPTSASTPARSPNTRDAPLPVPVHPILPPVPGFSAFLGMEALPEIERPTPAPEEPEQPKHLDDDAEAPANVDCPTCAEDVRILAREVPMAHHVNSTLVCRISGDVMDSDNEPLAFPNGCVYSSKVSCATSHCPLLITYRRSPKWPRIILTSAFARARTKHAASASCARCTSHRLLQ